MIMLSDTALSREKMNPVVFGLCTRSKQSEDIFFVVKWRNHNVISSIDGLLHICLNILQIIYNKKELS